MLDKLLVTDTSGKKSLTATAFIVGFAIVNLKLLLAGSAFGSVVLSPFSGGEYAAAVAALGTVYVLRRQKDSKETNDEVAKG